MNFQADLSDQKVVRVKEGTLHFPTAEIFENYMLGREEYPVVNEDSFESLFSLAGNQLRSNSMISEVEINAIPFEFRLTPINR
ncbi:hypothetical protein SAMN03080617_04253 [Algoriphagus alkaliphilus]|uniref:Uncharacterized protein n=1 Tax=Algoriphagus alkaliphilus TaxID=279824 RepID=A0A1G5ZPT0_9BACT|nr:hypothetical protein [Algoriphagus alkaliphilus]SDA96577.1 hypothetical protein SAMN03080617_04253 [Algoriphagus alkaliphilus]